MVAPLVTLQDGKVKGKISTDFLGGKYYSFLGIPYAKPPVKNLRFKAPVPIEPWNGIRDATREGPECPSYHMLFELYIGSEDNCLNLNVYTRQLPCDTTSLKPVMVWIHGGGFVRGSNRNDMYSPDYLITEDIVLVCINYRLGILGFLSLEDSSLEVPGNAGLKDMILALQWVQKNIQQFCGDPNNVTIFGESAGSASVHYLLLSPLSKGLFHKAIAQSGCSLNSWARGCSNGVIIAKNLEYDETDERKILEYLKSVPARKIVEAQEKTLDPFNAGTIRPFGPVVEKYGTKGAFLCEDPIDLIKSGKFHHVPLIMGYTSKEGMLFVFLGQLKFGHNGETNNFEEEIFFDRKLNMDSVASEKCALEIKKFYNQEENQPEKDIDKFDLLKTDNMFLYGIHTCVSHQKLVSQAPIYFYRMTLDTTNNHAKEISTTKHVYILMALYYLIGKLGDGLIKNMLFKLTKLIPQNKRTGACHSDDLYYLFRTFMNEKFEEGDENNTYILRFVRLWANFARTGDPTPDKNDPLIKVKWTPVNKSENCLLNIDKELKMLVDPDLERVKFWANLFE
ncbi:hypothetical protein Zmor_021865 [Zophobas morio]|uniref:Carboxylesterase type B domain-containing protein n=1 Tax=Zophobas morio TaxID=2755281 RepID=A0AA38I6D4_9CUCU|nr:hypothetical protein Zmor_021865 [Zophobas morio]